MAASSRSSPAHRPRRRQVPAERPPGKRPGNSALTPVTRHYPVRPGIRWTAACVYCLIANILRQTPGRHALAAGGELSEHPR